MKQHLLFQNNSIKKLAILSGLFLLFSVGAAKGQEVVINKAAVENASECNQFDVTLTVTGNPPPKPQEVVLIIDRSGSMDDGPEHEPIDFAQDAAFDFINEIFLPANNPTGLNRVAIVSYSGTATLDLGLTGSTGQQTLINTVNAITTGGRTNIEDAMIVADNELTANGTFDCATSRNIILLTDGVANERNDGGGTSSCSSTTANTACQTEAIAAGINAQTTTVNGEVFEQNIFSIGLVGAIDGTQQTIALNTIDQIQNAGFFFTENNADLSGIYSQILGQLVFAAKQLPGQALVTDDIATGFSLVGGSLNPSKGTTSVSGQTISWFVDEVTDETITLQYSITATTLPDICGIQTAGSTVINYENSECLQESQTFDNPDICVPCPELTTELTRQGCTNFFDYTGSVDQGGCSALSDDFSWEFFLNNVLVGTSDQLTGTFEYTGSDPLVGDLRAELSYDGTYGLGCSLPTVTSAETLTIAPPPEATSSITDVDCNGASTGAIDLTVTSGVPPYSFLWNTGATTEDLTNIPAGTYSVTITDSVGCEQIITSGLVVGEPDALVLSIDAQTNVECTGLGSVTIGVTGGTPAYQYAIDGGLTQASAVFNDIAPGAHTVEVTDANGCSETIDVFILNSCIGLVKTGVFNDENGDQCSDVGETITYTFVVTNEGNVSLDNIAVTDPLVSPITFVSGDTNNDGVLQVDETWTYTGNYAITQADIDAGNVQNQATVTGDDTNDNQVSDLSDESSVTGNDPTDTPICQGAEIAIVKTGVFNDENGDQCSDVGETITYTFVVTNEGNVSLDNIAVTDPLVSPISFVSGDTNNDGILQVDETWTYTGNYAITQADIDAGNVQNQATATGDDTNDNQVSDLSDESSVTGNDPTDTPLCQGAEIAIVKTGVFNDENGDQCSDVGETITYTFVVTNEGNVSLDNIAVTDPLVSPITFVSGDTNNDGILQVDETWTYTGSYAITQADIDAGNVQNQATATGDDTNDNQVSDLSDESSVTGNDPTDTPLCQGAEIAIVKTGVFNDENGDQCSDVGETITYTFVVTNEGNVSLDNIAVTDPLVSSISFVSGDTNNDGILQVDETWTYTGNYAITQADIDAGNVQNQATATGDDTNDNQVSDLSDESSVTGNDPTDTPLCQGAEIAIVKTGVFNDENGDQCSDVGETITYTFVVTNEGNVSLDNITVTDPLVSPISFVSGDTNNDGILQVDETWTYTGNYAITQADIDAGNVQNQATATGDDTNDNQVSDLSDESSVTGNDPTDTPLCQDPIIAIVKTGVFNDENGDQCSDVGETITYTFVVTNEGNVSLDNIAVTDPLVSPISFVSGDTNNDGILQVDETWTYTGNYAITQADIDAGEVVNQATATGVAPDQSQVSDLSGSTTTTDDATTTTLCQNPVIAIVKVGVFEDDNGNQCSDPDETITYTFTVTNEGNVSLSNVTVTDPLLNNVVFVSGDTNGDDILQVDETWTYISGYKITQDDIDAGVVINQATATAIAPDQTQVSDLSDESSVVEDDPTNTDLCQNPAIAIVKTSDYNDGGDCSDPGEIIIYRFTVTNQGNVTLTNIVVNDPLVGGVVPGPDSGDTDGDGALDVNETWEYTAEYTITQDDIDAGEVVNQATATGTAPDQSTVSDLSGLTVTTDDPTTTTLCQNPDIAIVKEADYDDGGDCSDPGEIINYTFTVTNEGNVTLSNIIVDDPLLGGVVAGPDSGDIDGDGALDVDETWIYTGSYTITQDDIDAGEVVNQATATGTAPDQSTVSDLSGSTTTTDDATTTTLCQSPAIAIVKEADYDDGGDCSDPGEVINYTFTVTNEGNVTLTNIVVDDPLLGGVVAGPDSGDVDNDNELDVDETWIYTGSYTITQDDIDAGEVVNQATATGTAPDQSTVSDLSGSTTTTDDTTTTTLCQSPAMAIVKVADYDDGGDCSDPGEVINYTFTVTNEGNVSLSDIVVDDPLLGGVVPGPDSGDVDGDNELDVTETWIFTGSYTITQDDIDAGQVVNQATATGTAPDQTQVSDLSGSTTTTDDTTTTTLCQRADIAIVKTSQYDDGGDCSQPGKMIFYTFTVTNEGNVSLSNIVVDDPLLGGVVPGPDSGDVDGDGELDVDEIWVYTGEYTITQDDINAGQVVNQATVTGEDPAGTTVSDLSGSTTATDDPTVTTLCQGPAIALIKVGTPDDQNGNDCVDVGETITYSFEVVNVGNVELTDVTVTDPLVAVTGGPITPAVGQSDTQTFTAVYTVTQDDIDAGEVINQATAEGTAPDGTVVMDLSDDNSLVEDDITIVGVCQNPAISLEKTSEFNDENGNGAADVGETITYSFVVTNTGDVTLYNVTIDDPLPGIVVTGGPIPVLEVGEVDDSTFSATYTITQADIDAGEVVNQALVTATDDSGTTVEDLSDDPNDLTDADANGDGDPDDPTTTTLPNVLPAVFEIFNGITPDGDGLNEFFQIEGIEDYPNNNVKIFNRWGVLVYETDGYGGSNVFRGISDGRATVKRGAELPTGTYYYILSFPAENPGERSYTGYLYINR